MGRWLSSHSADISGSFLDLGAGNRPFQPWYEPLSDRVVSIDAAPIPGLNAVGFASALPFRDRSFDAILCTSVLEHVDFTEGAVAEIARVLRPGGRLLVTVPFLYPTHEAPYDYWRTTHYGLRSVLERHGLVVDDLAAEGGPIILLVHFVVLALVQALRVLGDRLGRLRWLVDNRAIRLVIAAPQEAFRAKVPYRLSPVARAVSLGYMAAARLPATDETMSPRRIS
jgi:SAM-dependent methyltransferase